MKKTMSCICTFLPLVFLAITFVLLIPTAILGEIGETAESAILVTFMVVLMLIMFLVALASAVLTWVYIIRYIIKTYRNPALSNGMKILWYVLLYFFNVFVFPVYWFMYIKQEF